MQTLKVKIIGARPLLHHSDKFADPLNPMTKAHKELNAKRKKTDEDFELIAKSEWRGGLYFDEDIGPYLPGVNIEAALIAGGKLSKLGAQLKRSVEIMDTRCPIIYKGPRTIEGLWDAAFYDARSVKVGTSRFIRYRPLFREWSTICEIAYDQESIDRAQVLKCLEDAGQYCGVGDYRPKFGRFTVEVL
ncbi:hypothetical protein [Pseudomonas lactis]|uniref:hypothetical protein n=1 Tax=Pseudomonas lactis TaxID=1615674 RepID=UPI00190CF29A|nr:hypothetical protein [Pseudomonas lactis]MBK3444142.1 hypothetical protein [Pseudomonas lactis]